MPGRVQWYRRSRLFRLKTCRSRSAETRVARDRQFGKGVQHELAPDARQQSATIPIREMDNRVTTDKQARPASRGWKKAPLAFRRAPLTEATTQQIPPLWHDHHVTS